MERYKVYEYDWPWKIDREAWYKLLNRTVNLFILNTIIIGPLAYSPFYFFNLPVDLDYTMEGLPNSARMMTQIFFCMLMEDMTFHYSHKTLHHPRLYGAIHKIHHEYKETISITA